MNKRGLENYIFGEAFYGKIPKEQAKKMALLWGEGSENLTNLIEYCILNDIGTFASCKGHGELAEGYIGFTRMPKDFFKYLMNYMQEDGLDGAIRYMVSRFGDHEPRLSIMIFSRREGREEKFKKILEGIKEYSKTKDNIDLSKINKTFDETVEYIFSKEGFGKERMIKASGEAKPYRRMSEYVIDGKDNITYAYSPIRRFCRSSRKKLSSVLGVPKRIIEQLHSKENQKNDRERE